MVCNVGVTRFERKGANITWKMRILLTAILGLLLALPADALDPRRAIAEYRHTIWTSKDGLPATFIFSITQSSDGYIWLGSTDGLARFDGIQFMHWRTRGNRILLGAVRVVRAARDEGVWVGTASGLVGHVRGDDLTSTTTDAPVEALLEARDGTVWVATAKRIVRFRPDTLMQIGPAINLPADFHSGLLQDEEGFIWLNTSRGVEQIEPASGELQPKNLAEGKSWLSQDRNGTIWITRPDGGTHTLREERPIQTPNHGNALDVRTVVRDNEGSTWIGTLGKGLFRLRSNAGESLPEQFSRVDGLSNDNVRSLFEDREHNLWVGTQDGLESIRDGAITTLKRGEGVESDNVDALAAGPEGIVWASTSIAIDRIDSGHRESYLKGTAVKALFMDREKTLWAGTGAGVVRMTNGIWSPVYFPPGLSLNNVVAIAGDERGRIWFSDADKGLFRWSSQKIDDFSNEPLLQGRSILTIREDSKGRVWFGFYEGGVAIFEEGVFRRFSQRDGLADGSINAIAVDDNGIVWIGAERGLSRFDGNRFVTWNSTHGLPGERVFWIIPVHDDHLWLGYTTGVARVSRMELDVALHNPPHLVAQEFFDNGDGLKGNLDRGWQSPAVQASDGTIWFKTSAGVAFIDPAHLPRNPLVPPVHIERMFADTAVVDIKTAVRLRPFTRNVQFDYTALSLVEPRRVHFRYKLEGYDSDWQDAGTRRQAFYTNLGPRKYRFRVLGSNNDGLWNEAGAALEFELLPAFYQTQWFTVVFLIILMIGAWGAYRMRMWQLATTLRGRFEERLRERTRIAQELHDNLLQSILGISLQIEVTDELLPPELPAKHPLQKALRLSKSAMDEGRRALNDLRASSLSTDDLVKGFRQTADGLRTESGTEIRILVEGHERPLNPVTGNDVLQIGRQAIANAFQHAGGGKIRVLLSYGKRDLRISVHDNGSGIDEDTIARGRPGHHGIRGMRERAERIGATLSIKSSAGQGTEVELIVPADLVYQTETRMDT
jgi:ligand-binding sensor domain-containing protein/signal transduction histidine kinase